MFLTSRFPAMGFDQFWVSPPEFFEFRELNQSFASVGAFTTGELNLMAGERPVRVRGAAVTDDLLTTLGVAPAQGRLFAPGETNANGPQLAILSHELWQSALGGRPIVGQTVDLDGVRARGDRRHAAEARRDGQPRRGLAAARPRPGQPPESRQPLSST